jgi:hypothetical protein
VELALIVIAILFLDLAAARWGVDSRDVWRADNLDTFNHFNPFR